MHNISPYVIIILSLIIAIPVSRVLVNQIGRFVSDRARPFFYLLIAAIPVYEIIRLASTLSGFYKIPYFYFWILFLTGLIILFFIELKNG